LKLILVLIGKRLRARKVFWRAMNFKGDTGESVVKSFLDERDCKVRNVDAYPLAIKFLRGVNSRSASAKWIKHHVAGVGGRGDYAFEKGERLLGGVAETFYRLGV
jgi:hypothetical protein